jgi:hypothetical protein
MRILIILLFLFIPGCGIISDHNVNKLRKALTTPPNFNNPTLERRLEIGNRFDEEDWPPAKKNEIWFKFTIVTFEF